MATLTTNIDDGALKTYADNAASTAVSGHVSAADPHTQYQKESEKGQPNGYAALDASGQVPVAQIPAIVQNAAMGKILVVNSESGDNATAQRGSWVKQFEDLDAAYLASVAGDVIVILDAGTYAITEVLTKDFNLYAPLATIDPNGGSVYGLGLGVNGLHVTIECNLFDGYIQATDGASNTSGHTITINRTSGLYTCNAGASATVNVLYSNVFQEELVLDDDSTITAIGGTLGQIDYNYTPSYASGVVINVTNCYIYSINIGCTLNSRGSTFIKPIDQSFVTIGTNDANVGLVYPQILFQFSTTTTDADPGAGTFRFNNATIDSVTQAFIDRLDYDGNDLTALFDDLNGGRLIMREMGGTGVLAFTYGTVTTATGYRKIALTYILGALPTNGSFWTFEFDDAGSGGGDLLSTNNLSDLDDADAARTNLGLAIGTDVQAYNANLLVEPFTGEIAVAANDTYTLDLYAPFGYTINTLNIICSSGTVTAAIQINGTSVTGISAVSVSSTIATGTATAANVVSAGDKVTLVLSSNSAALKVAFTLKFTRS